MQHIWLGWVLRSVSKVRNGISIPICGVSMTSLGTSREAANVPHGMRAVIQLLFDTELPGSGPYIQQPSSAK